MAGIYTCDKSSSDSDSNLYTSCHGYQTKRKNKQCIMDMVSHWTKNTAEHLGLFYNEEPTPLDEFKIMLSSSGLKFVSGTPAKLTLPFKDESKHLLDTLIDLTKNCVNVSFSIDENKPDFFKGTVKKEMSAARRTLWERRVTIDAEHQDDDGYTGELVPKESGLSRFQLQTCYYHTYDFLKTYLHFLENGSDNKGWNKSDFTTLLSQFITIFMLSPQPGKSNKRNQVLGGVPTTSIPELRIVSYEQFPLTLGVITVIEEKLNMPCDMDLYSTEDIPANAVGQHAVDFYIP
ncbi:uncharacterized protein LOC133173105 isoform X2 [Saccostrea echinata]|uniref:uncharacterized protein LOC133173105 isoform X2 n=1 Tax=Saccostrea echinata TaxID=191078 RepID=UPI002A808B49|nr:uncharacterized protein LOC133173105 isoform X2 [Saccostrea echinata]